MRISFKCQLVKPGTPGAVEVISREVELISCFHFLCLADSFFPD